MPPIAALGIKRNLQKMTEVKKKLLNSDDLKTLYRITNPKLENKPNLMMVIRYKDKEWEIQNPYLLRGYRACQNNLESLVKNYVSQGIWPTQCDLGIGVFENEKLIKVLIVTDLGYRQVKQSPPSLPLDDILGAIGLTRNDIK
jgi:hypothetical protein